MVLVSYHQKNLRNNIKVKVHKEYCDKIFFNFSAIYCLIIVKFGGHLPFSIIYKFYKWDFSLQPTGDPREHHPGDAWQRTSSLKIFFLCKSIEDNNIGDLYERKFIPTFRRTSGTTSRWRSTRNIVTKSSFFNFSAIYCPIIIVKFFFLCKTIIQEIHLRENSFLQSEEPQGQHQGEGDQGILWRNFLSSIYQPLICRSIIIIFCEHLPILGLLFSKIPLGNFRTSWSSC